MFYGASSVPSDIARHRCMCMRYPRTREGGLKLMFSVDEHVVCQRYLVPSAMLHNATCNMQLAACNRIASCVLEMLRVACSVKMFHTNGIVVYSLQYIAWSFKGFTGNAVTKHLRRRGDYSETYRFYILPGRCGYQNGCVFVDWAKIDVLQVRPRRSCKYGEQGTIFIPARRRPTTSLRPATPARHA